MAGFLKTLNDKFRYQLLRHRNLPFLKATMAASAMIAIANGSISFSERIRLDQIIKALEALKVFDPHEGVNLFNEYADAILKSPATGRIRAMKAIKAVAKDPETAALLIRVCLAISEAKGEMYLVEKIEIVSLCSTLGIEPERCGLDSKFL